MIDLKIKLKVVQWLKDRNAYTRWKNDKIRTDKDYEELYYMLGFNK